MEELTGTKGVPDTVLPSQTKICAPFLTPTSRDTLSARCSGKAHTAEMLVADWGCDTESQDPTSNSKIVMPCYNRLHQSKLR